MLRVPDILRDDADVRLYRAKQVAQLLGIHPMTLWAWVRDGKFPKPFKLSDMSTCWRARDVIRFLDDKQNVPFEAQGVSTRESRSACHSKDREVTPKEGAE
jgi:predicted DNA-binding transcriptional regulator AlpA